MSKMIRFEEWGERGGFLSGFSRDPEVVRPEKPTAPEPSKTSFSWVRVIACVVAVIAFVNMGVKISNDKWEPAIFYLVLAALAIAAFAIAEMKK